MEIAARLRQLGFPSNYVGFPYLACAISLVQTEPEYLYQVFKCLYPAVATAFQTSAACVERDIRTLLCAYWRSGGQPLLQAISPRPLTARPTVSEVISMLTEAELLQYIYQTTEMGRDGIQSVLPHAEDETFHQALEQQLTEYEKLYGATGKMLRERGQEPKGLNPMVKASSEMMSAMKTMADHSTSKIAEMMIQGNTMGMTKSLKHLHDYHGKDERVRDLANKLLKTEEANIQQMKKFL